MRSAVSMCSAVLYSKIIPLKTSSDILQLFYRLPFTLRQGHSHYTRITSGHGSRVKSTIFPTRKVNILTDSKGCEYLYYTIISIYYKDLHSWHACCSIGFRFMSGFHYRSMGFCEWEIFHPQRAEPSFMQPCMRCLDWNRSLASRRSTSVPAHDK